MHLELYFEELKILNTSWFVAKPGNYVIEWKSYKEAQFHQQIQSNNSYEVINQITQYLVSEFMFGFYFKWFDIIHNQQEINNEKLHYLISQMRNWRHISGSSFKKIKKINYQSVAKVAHKAHEIIRICHKTLAYQKEFTSMGDVW